ncbi:hypothetical protein D1822_12540 [Phaeobacter inhibens]|uniref:hypothetical protein n=1 Tax=Phaeobacter inhibens TaxID=221822 RepID=UPI0001632B3D|nr:hypothetical protein [Phaeobacter inhibens]AFO92239.1 hypothetical protein PGA1_c25630 [Phaeobacter inhibens DSM 17395]AUQ46929.1 hypothetical protein PhaeoP10_02602 [Phaeobacter inhibens]AXT23579.1 hypothetical protein D1822_12540 [Phaeobacter inhibens]
MTLTNLIDLIAEVAAKRATQEGGTKEETPNAVILMIAVILAGLWQRSCRFGQIEFVFHAIMRQPHGARRP